MSIVSQRDSLRRSGINLDRIRRTLVSFNVSMRSARTQSNEILKQTRERNTFKSGLISKDERFFRLRQENVKRKRREDALEATSITGATKVQGTILQKSSRGFLGRMLDFIGILIIGWSVKNLPRIIKGINQLVTNIRSVVSVLSNFVSRTGEVLVAIGKGLDEFFFKFRRFDYTLNRVFILETINKITTSLFTLTRSIINAFNRFEKDPDLDKAIKDHQKRKNQKEENNDEEPDIPGMVEQKFKENSKFNEDTDKKLKEALQDPFSNAANKLSFDMNAFFNKDQEDGKQQESPEISEFSREFDAFDAKIGGIDNVKKRTEITREKLKNLEKGDVNEEMISNIFNLGDKAMNNAKESILAIFADAKKARKPKERAMGGPVEEGETYIVGEKGPEIFNPIDPQNRSNKNLGVPKRKRNTIFIVEKAVGNNGIQFNGGSGESSTNFARSSSMASALNTLQSAELKYT